MADATNIKNLIVQTSCGTFRLSSGEGGGDNVYEDMGLTMERFAELLSRDFYCPTLSMPPDETTLTYTDTDGSVNHFSIGQMCRWKESGEWRLAFMLDNSNYTAVWGKMESLGVSDEALVTAQEANLYARESHTLATEAADTANVAKQAVAALEGLANTDEAQQTLAGQVVQIAQNASDIKSLKQQHVLLTENEYENLETVDQTKLYMIYER